MASASMNVQEAVSQTLEIMCASNVVLPVLLAQTLTHASSVLTLYSHQLAGSASPRARVVLSLTLMNLASHVILHV